MLKRICGALVAVLLIMGASPGWAAEYPVDVSGVTAAVLMDKSATGVVFEYNADKRAEVGGLSRLPVLLAVCKKIDSGAIKLEDTVLVSAAASRVKGPTAFLETNESVGVGTLLKAAVMICAGDAIYALAEAAYGSAEACVLEVNELLRALEIEASYADIADSTTGFTAREMAKIGAALMQSNAFSLYSGIFYDGITHADGRVTELASSNRLLKTCVGCAGVGTGSSPNAGYCGVFAANRGDNGFVCAVFGAANSAQRAQTGKSMLEYAFAAFDAVTLANAGDVMLDSIEVKSGTLNSVALVASKSAAALLPKNAKLEENWDIPDTIQAPAHKTDAVGKVTYTLNGDEIAVVELFPAENVERAAAMDYVKRALIDWLHA